MVIQKHIGLYQVNYSYKQDVANYIITRMQIMITVIVFVFYGHYMYT